MEFVTKKVKKDLRAILRAENATVSLIAATVTAVKEKMDEYASYQGQSFEFQLLNSQGIVAVMYSCIGLEPDANVPFFMLHVSTSISA
mmetsp:Transcript_6390/g.24033  ORF Transcript_6390/g.24033 Transcript_6390/m.24033 type:complete len:88 (+) Transcript_6390:819-1082(+)